MRKLKLFLHTSLDGFVAGPNGEMDWIQVNDEMFDFVGNFTKNSDTYLLGRKTFDLMEGYWPAADKGPNPSKHTREHAAWYRAVEKVVMSKSLKGKNPGGAKIISDDIKENITQLKNKPGKDIIMIGSPSAAHSLMKDSLIDTYIMFVNPVLRGKGIPMFDKIESQQNLKWIESKTFPNGVMYVQYDRV